MDEDIREKEWDFGWLRIWIYCTEWFQMFMQANNKTISDLQIKTKNKNKTLFDPFES